jgi:CheY-like chemotaxis protein
VGPARTSLDKHRRGAQPVAVGGKTNYLERCTDFRGCERAAVGDGGQKPISFDVGVRAAIARANHPFVEEQAHRVLVGISSSSQLAPFYRERGMRAKRYPGLSVFSGFALLVGEGAPTRRNQPIVVRLQAAYASYVMPTRSLLRLPHVDRGAHRAAASASILCVDDDPDGLEALELFLMSEGFEVITARNGDEALLRVREQWPDLIITDYTMPGMTGLDLCKRLRASRVMRRIPIILYTGVSLPADRRLYDRIVTKPADLDAFANQIRVLLAANH